MKRLLPFALVAMLAASAFAQDEISQAKNLIQNGQCAEAIAPLQRVYKSSFRKSAGEKAAVMLTECYLREHKRDEALKLSSRFLEYYVNTAYRERMDDRYGRGSRRRARIRRGLYHDRPFPQLIPCPSRARKADDPTTKNAFVHSRRRSSYIVVGFLFMRFEDGEKGADGIQRGHHLHVALDGALLRCQREEEFVKAAHVFPRLCRTVLREVLRERQHQRLAAVEHIYLLPLLLRETVRTPHRPHRDHRTRGQEDHPEQPKLPE